MRGTKPTSDETFRLPLRLSGMAHEIELKLDAASTAAQRVLDAAWLKRLEIAAPKREHLVSVYYDTAACTLRERGMSLRVRHSGKRRIQTVKAGPRGACGPFCRQEWEREIAGNRPDLHGAGDRALECFPRKKLKRELRPVFATDITRTAIPVRYRDSEVEIAIDRGEVRTRRRQMPISEIELELKSGDPAQLVRLARRIARATRAGYGIASKAERGYGLSRGDGPAPIFAREILLTADMTAGDALTTIGLACLHHFAANRAAVEAGDSEGVHQMRVGLRRLRAAFSFFKDLLHDAESERIKRDLRWLLGELGPARDLDVLISETVEPLRRERAGGAELAILMTDLNHRRRSGFERAKEAVASDRFRQIVLDTALWTTGGAWTTGTEPLAAGRRTRCVADFAAEEFARRNGKIRKKLKKVAKLNPRRRHKLRIAAKKLRYADEFFASLYDTGRAKRRLNSHGEALKTLQSALGKLNDMYVHRKAAGDFVNGKHRAKKKAQKAFALGLISGDDRAHIAALMHAATKAGKHLAAAKSFWN
jgi:inorganic triphosphatase YgiF